MLSIFIIMHKFITIVRRFKLKNNLITLALSGVTAAMLIGCGGGGSSSSAVDVVVERGPLIGATVTDSNGVVATAITAGSNTYRFTVSPSYPITATGGVIDLDGNGIDTGDLPFTGSMKSFTEVITPATTLIGDPESEFGKKMIESLKEMSGITDEDELLRKVPSQASAEAISLANGAFEAFRANFDDDDTNDIDLNDDGIFEAQIANLKTKYDSYKTLIEQSYSEETDLVELARNVENEYINNSDEDILDDDIAQFIKDNFDSESNYESEKIEGEELTTVPDNSAVIVFDGISDYVIKNMKVAKGLKVYPYATLDCSTILGFTLDQSYDTSKINYAFPTIGSSMINFYVNEDKPALCVNATYTDTPIIGGTESLIIVMENIIEDTSSNDDSTSDSTTNSLDNKKIVFSNGDYLELFETGTGYWSTEYGSYPIHSWSWDNSINELTFDAGTEYTFTFSAFPAVGVTNSYYGDIVISSISTSSNEIIPTDINTIHIYKNASKSALDSYLNILSSSLPISNVSTELVSSDLSCKDYGFTSISETTEVDIDGTNEVIYNNLDGNYCQEVNVGSGDDTYGTDTVLVKYKTSTDNSSDNSSNTDSTTPTTTPAEYIAQIQELIELFGDRELTLTTTNYQMDTYEDHLELKYPITCSDIETNLTCYDTNLVSEDSPYETKYYLELLNSNISEIATVHTNDSLEALVIDYETAVYNYFDIQGITMYDTTLSYNDIADLNVRKLAMKLKYANTSNVTDMSNLFMNTAIIILDINDWDVSSVTDMNGMFNGLIFTNVNADLSNWDVSNVLDMSSMFVNTDYETNTIKGIENWDVSSVTNMSMMFSTSLYTPDLSNWNVSSVISYDEFADSIFPANYLPNFN
jgi:surface protein